VSIGNYDRFGGEAYISGGIAEKVAADLAIVYANQDDYYGKNLFTGNGVGYENNLSVRSKVIIDVSEDTRIKLTAAFTDNEGDNGMTRKLFPGFVSFGTVAPDNFHDINSTFDPGWESENIAFSLHFEHNFGNVN